MHELILKSFLQQAVQATEFGSIKLESEQKTTFQEVTPAHDRGKVKS
jgi:hypothetical protein